MKSRIVQSSFFLFKNQFSKAALVICLLLGSFLHQAYAQRDKSSIVEEVSTLAEKTNTATNAKKASPVPPLIDPGQRSSQTNLCNYESEITVENITQGGPVDTVGCENSDTLEICFNVYIFFTYNSNWLHGLVPDFGDCINVFPTVDGEPGAITTPMTNIANDGEWEWFPDDVVTYNYFGYYPPGTPVGPGWFYNYRQGNNPTCLDYSNPNCTWGDNGNGPWEVCFLAEALCTDPGLNFCEISFKTFADGETGGYFEATGCEVDEPWTYEFSIDCCIEYPEITNDTLDFTVCSGDSFELDLTSNMDPETTYDWTVASNPYGASSGTGTTISDVLTNTTGSPVTVNYVVTPTCALGCVGEPVIVTVTINPEVDVELVSSANPVCEGDCVEIQVLTDSPYQACIWDNNLGTSTPLTVCPQLSSVYSVTVTDVYGCTGEGQILVDVIPPVYASIFASATEICENGPDFPITLNAIGFGGDGFFGYEWSTGETTPSISVTESGYYSVIIFDVLGGCYPGYADIPITIFPVPLVSVTGPTELCVDDGLVCYEGSPMGGIWGGAATDACIDPASLGVGSHTLTYDYIDQNGCSASVDYEIIVMGTVIQPEQLPDIVICDDVSTETYTIEEVPFASSYEWSVTGTGTIVSGQGTNTIEIIWSGTPGGEVCVYANSECGPSDPSCFEVSINLILVASFDLPASICETGTATITYSGNAGNNANFIWDLDGGIVVAGDPDLGSCVVQWTNPGEYSISLQVEENACLSSIETQTIQVDPTLEELNITCNPSTDMVEFFWNSIPEAVEYIVNGQVQSGTSYIINNLVPGTPVSISVEAVGTGACGSVFAQSSCTTQDCPTINIQIEEVAALCQETSGPVSLQANVTGGNWSGPGITDAVNGIFDPSLANTGINVVTYELQNGPCVYSNSLEIEVEAPLEDLTITCNSTVDAVTFSWNAINGANGYLVNGISQLSTTYELTNLQPSTPVNISVEAVGTGACGSVFAQSSCTTQDCPAINIQIEEVAALCQETSGPVSLQANVAGGNWSGPGITDAINGIFDPSLVNAGIHVVTYELQNGPCVYSNSLEIEVDAPLEALAITCNSTVDAVTFSWNAINGANGYLVNGLPQFSTTYEITNLQPGTPVSISVEAVGNGACGSVFAQSRCTTQDCPPVTINLQADQNLCLNALPADIIDLMVSVQGGDGTGVWSGPGIIDAANGLFDPNASGVSEGANEIVFTYEDGVCTYVEYMIISVFSPPIAEAGEPMALTCTDDELILAGTGNGNPSWEGPGIINGADTYTPTINAPGMYYLTITDPTTGCSAVDFIEIVEDINLPDVNIQTTGSLDCSGSAVILETESQNGVAYEWTAPDGSIFNETTIEASLAGYYTIIATNLNNGCTASEEILVENNTLIPTADAGGDKEINCLVSEVVLDGNISQTGANLEYLWTGPPGGIAGPADQLQITAILGGTYVLKVTDVSNNCFSEDAVNVSSNLTVPEVEAGPFQEIGCNDEYLSLNGTTDADVYFWVNQNAAVISSNLDLEIDSPGWYFLNATNTQNGCTASDSVFVSIDEDVPHDAVLDIKSVTCHGDQDGAISVEAVIGGSAPYQYSLDGQNFSESSEWQFLAGGSYQLMIRDAEGCVYEKDLVLLETPELLIVLGPDIVMELGESQTINIQTNFAESQIDEIFWTPQEEINCLDDNCLDVLVNPVETTNFQVAVVHSSGCIVEDEIQLRVKKNRGAFIPNVFTPNGDGINDVFYIQGPSAVNKVTRFIIMDRWGAVVFENENFLINDPGQGWDGLLQGKTLNPGVFVYLAEVEFIDGHVMTFKGDLTLIR